MATAATTTAQITADEFFAMDLGEGRFDLVRGEIVAMPPPEYLHGLICANIGTLLHLFGRRTGLGHVASNDAAVRIGVDTVRGADVSYYSEARWPRAMVGHGPAPVVPDLVAEVLSPSDRTADVLDKVADYLAAGVAVVWLVHPDRRTLTIYRADDPTPTVLAEQDAVEDLPELPGFACRVADLFA